MVTTMPWVTQLEDTSGLSGLCALRVAFSAMAEEAGMARPAGLEPLHQEFVSRRLHCCHALRRGQIVHAPAGSPPHDLLPLFAPHDSDRPNWARFLMRRFESCRPSQPVRLQRVTYEDRSKTARHREVSQI
jgi:hypothetical protein